MASGKVTPFVRLLDRLDFHHWDASSHISMVRPGRTIGAPGQEAPGAVIGPVPGMRKARWP
ncbi:hypothetical protein GCM10022420_048390 [Streptomyces iranensis]